MLATLREHAPGERDAAVVAGLVAWASGAFAGADASALPVGTRQGCEYYSE